MRPGPSQDCGREGHVGVLSHWVGRGGVTIKWSVWLLWTNKQLSLILPLELARASVVHEGRGRKPLLPLAPAQNGLLASACIPSLTWGVARTSQRWASVQEHGQVPPFPSHSFFPSRSHLKDVA